jgi:hypothetical protein
VQSKIPTHTKRVGYKNDAQRNFDLSKVGSCLLIFVSL